MRRLNRLKAVIIPTLNEEGNIGLLIESIFNLLGTDDVRVIVVDDDSSDRTRDIVQGLSVKFVNLLLIHRTTERGLGSAVRAGAKEALSDYVVVMDADFSHNPIHLKSMFQKLEQGYDIVVGSRYEPGGKIVGWPGSRIAISKIATSMARFLFRVPVKDSMSGFVGCKSGAIVANGFKHADFKFLLEMLATDKSLRATEVPIVFQDRVKGSSKLGNKTILLHLELLLRLFIKSGTRKTKSRGKVD